MTYQDLFVGSVAISLGLLSLIAAIRNWELCYQSWKAEWLEALGGRLAVRAVYAMLGLGLISLGLAIAAGFAPNKSAVLAPRLLPAFADRQR